MHIPVILCGEGEKEKWMTRVKSRHVQSSYLWIVKLQMILILFIIFFCVLHNVCVCVCVCVWSLSHILLFTTLRTHRLLCPWDFSAKNTGVGCHFLLQGIFLTQGFEPASPVAPALQVDSLLLSHQMSDENEKLAGWETGSSMHRFQCSNNVIHTRSILTRKRWAN